jgi:hypothetical protein
VVIWTCAVLNASLSEKRNLAAGYSPCPRQMRRCMWP